MKARFNYFYTCYSTLDHDAQCITWLLTVVAQCHDLALCSSRSKWGGDVILIKSTASRAQILRAVLYEHTVAPAGALLVPLWHLGPLSIQPKSPEILVRTSNGQTISVWSDQNIRDQLWRWSTLTTLVFSVGQTEMSLSIWENCCPQCRSFLSCLQEQ